MKIAVVGGHFSPAYALIQALPERHSVIFLGRKNAIEGDKSPSFEYLICQKLNIPFYDIPAGRLQRKFTKYSIPSFLKVPKGFATAFTVLKKEKPGIVLSFGGYLSVPIVMAARALSIPIVIHEQTQKAGLANRVIGRLFADKVLITFESSKKYFPKGKTVVTGNPLRKEVFEQSAPLVSLGNEKLMYITGGSTGSHFINNLIYQNLSDLLSAFIIVHQTGDSQDFHDFETLSERAKSLPESLRKKYIIKKFVEPSEIGWILQNVSVVVSRAGINTVLELIELGIPSLLIPLPHGQRDEQLENAKLLKSKGIGDYMLQKDVANDSFIEAIKSISLSKRKNNVENSQNPAYKLIDIIEKYEKEFSKKDKKD